MICVFQSISDISIKSTNHVRFNSWLVITQFNFEEFQKVFWNDIETIFIVEIVDNFLAITGWKSVVIPYHKFTQFKWKSFAFDTISCRT